MFLLSTIAKKKLKAFYGLAIILLLIFSCRKKEAIGLEVQPDSQIGVVFTDTITLFTEPVLFNDSIITSDENYLLAGAYQDPIFGNITTKGYAQFVQNNENRDVLTDFSTIDSVVLNLNYIYHYGDSTQAQTINVFELSGAKGDLYKDSVYKSIEINKIPTYDATPLNNVDNTPFEAKPSTKNQKIKLDEAFGEKIIKDVIKTGINNTDFKTAFKGLALIPKDNETQGIVMALDLANNGNRITIYYKKTGSIRDSVVLLANNGQARFHTITSDRGATQLSTLQTNGNFKQTGTAGEMYLQSGIGIRTRVRMPGLSNFKAKVGNVAINRAELLITDENYNETDKLESQPIPLLRLLKLNSDGTIRKLLSGSNYAEFPIIADNLLGTSDPYSVGFNKPTKTFSFDISSYIHSVIHDVEPNYGVIISTPPSAMKITVNRIFVPAGFIKLKIYYTKVN